MHPQLSMLFAEKSHHSALRTLKKYGIAVIPDYLETNSFDKLNHEFFLMLTGNYQSIQNRSSHPSNKMGVVVRLDMNHEKSQNEFPALRTLFRDEFMEKLVHEYYAPYS